LGKLIKKLRYTKRPLLQVALDFTSLEDMIRLLKKISNLPIDIFEVGTPLIKAEGMKAVSVLKAFVAPEALVLADMKTADVGELEVKLAYDAGADITTVLASSDNEVIRSALKAGNELDTDVVVDTIGISNVRERIKELVFLGANLVNLHVGIDVQKTRGLTAGDIASKYSHLINEFGLYFSISGGIKAKDVYKIKDLGFHVIVVGSAITRSPNPRRSAELFISELHKK